MSDKRFQDVTDVKSLITYFGGPVGLSNAVAEAGFTDIKSTTVEGWRDHNAVPTRWLPAVTYVLAARGLRAPDFLQKGFVRARLRP